MPFEINIRNENWLVASTYKTPFQKNEYFLWHLINLFEFYSNRYEKVIILVDFNIKGKIK